MTALLVWLAANNPGEDGTIWIEDAYDSGSNVTDTGLNFTLSGITLSNMAVNSLTIQGGWDGVVDSTTITGSSEFNGYLAINDWAGNVTVNNIFIDGSTSHGLTVTNTDGNVTLNDVEVNSASGDGIRVTNTSGNLTADNVNSHHNDANGMYVNNTNNTTITDSDFSNNGQQIEIETDTTTTSAYAFDGLYANVDGNVTLTNVTASDNKGDGAELHADGSIEITSSDFDNNGDFYSYVITTSPTQLSYGSYNGNGLIASADGNITLDDVTADGNGGDGAFLRTDSGDIEVTDSEFTENGFLGGGDASLVINPDGGHHSFGIDSFSGTGLAAYGDGSITLLNVIASNNGGTGADLQADIVNVTDSEFNENGWGRGIFDDSFGYGLLNGLVTGFCDALPTPYQANAFDPCTDSGYIDVQASNFSYYVVSAQGLDGYVNSYSINQYADSGLDIEAETVTLNQVVANINGGKGADIDTYGNVNVTQSEFIGNGLLGDLYVSECLGDGDYASSCNTPYFASDTESIYVANLAFSYSGGLDIYSDYGDVTLSNVSAQYNANNGVSIEADEGSISIGTIDPSDANFFIGNGAYPVQIGGTDGLNALWDPYWDSEGQRDGLFGEFLYDALGLDFTINLPVSDFELSLGFYETATSSSNLFVNLYFHSGSGLHAYAEDGSNSQYEIAFAVGAC